VCREAIVASTPQVLRARNLFKHYRVRCRDTEGRRPRKAGRSGPTITTAACGIVSLRRSHRQRIRGAQASRVKSVSATACEYLRRIINPLGHLREALRAAEPSHEQVRLRDGPLDRRFWMDEMCASPSRSAPARYGPIIDEKLDRYCARAAEAENELGIVQRFEFDGSLDGAQAARYRAAKLVRRDKRPDAMVGKGTAMPVGRNCNASRSPEFSVRERVNG